MNAKQSDTDELLRRTEAGDLGARDELLRRYRLRLRRMVDVHLDQRLATRVDPSDIVQDALIAAAAGLSGYLEKRPLPFYPGVTGDPPIGFGVLRNLGKQKTANLP